LPVDAAGVLVGGQPSKIGGAVAIGEFADVITRSARDLGALLGGNESGEDLAGNYGGVIVACAKLV